MVGLGKLGLPVALAIEYRGHEVFGYDVNPEVKTYLEKGFIPFREEGLDPLLRDNHIKWCESVAEVVENSDIVFLAIQTPHLPEYEGSDVLPDDRRDFSYDYLKSGLAEVAKACAECKQETVVAVISTCLPGTFERELKPLLNEYTKYAYVPQFIAMGTVLEDYLNPEFDLLGVVDENAARIVEDFYATINDAPIVRTDVTTAEGAKVLYNCWLTAKTVIANTAGELSERLGMDFDAIKKTWDLSTRRIISPRYMSAGVGDGGSCHGRDNIAMSWLAGEAGMSHNFWEDLMLAREEHAAWHAELAVGVAAEKELPLILLGRAFKPETDIETGSAAILMANILIRSGERFLHVNDLDHLVPAVYFIATKNERYGGYRFPAGSVVLDPFGFIKDQEGVEVRRLGRR